MTEHYGLRLTVDNIEDEQMNYFKDKGLLLAVKEKGSETEKPYYHLCFGTSNLNTLKMYVKRQYPGGNKIKAYAWTRKIKDLDAQYRYLSKGNDCDSASIIAYNVGIDIDHYRVAYWDQHDLVTAAKQKSKRPILQCCEEINEQFDQYSLDSTIGEAILVWDIQQFQRPPSCFAMPTWIILYKGKKSSDLNQPDIDIGV